MGQAGGIESHYVVQQKIERTVNANGERGVAAGAADAGTFGVVRRGIDTRSNQPCAIKNIVKGSSEHKERVLEEIAMMKAVSGQHPNIVRFIEFFEEWGSFDLVFEFCGNGTLADGIRNKSINEKDAAGFCHQLLSALAFLKGRGVLHRDVKPANVLLVDAQTSKLADFGSATALNSDETLINKSGTPAFFSPEMTILPRGQGYSFPADVWAAGITFYMMLFHSHPFISKGAMDDRLLKVGCFDSGMMWLHNAKLLQLLRWLLMPCPFPGQRIFPENACNHTWLSQYGFGSGSFSTDTPTKLVPDSYGRWCADSYF